MSEPWVDKLDHYLYIINDTKIGKIKVSKSDVELLFTNIVKPYNLSAKEILNLVFANDFSFTEIETAYLVLETAIEYEDIESHDFEEICYKIISLLDIPDKNWDWLNGSTTDHFNDYYSKIRLLCALASKLASENSIINQPLMLDILTTLSYHIHPKVPWATKLTTDLIEEFISSNDRIKEMIYRLLPQFVDEKLKPEVLDLSSSRANKSSNLSLSNPKLSTAGYAKANGLKPRLGYGGAKSAILEEEIRQNWKLSTKVKSISMIWYLIQIISENEYMDQYWSLVTSFILNLIDDPDPLMKAQSCELLNLFMSKIDNEDYNNHLLVKSGLSDLFLESCKTSLSYLPNMTPFDKSLYLLSIAYPIAIRLCDLRSKKEGNLSFIELINSNILASIAHLHNKDGYRSHYKLITLLVDQLDIIVKNNLKTDVLICFSRINFTINQLIANPNIFEAGSEGLNCIISVLTVQHSILQSFYNLQDIEGIKLILAYKYDFLGVWSVLQNRIQLSLVEGYMSETLELFDLNFDLLKKLSSCCGLKEFESLTHDVRHILLSNPNLHFSID